MRDWSNPATWDEVMVPAPSNMAVMGLDVLASIAAKVGLRVGGDRALLALAQEHSGRADMNMADVERMVRAANQWMQECREQFNEAQFTWPVGATT